jgi:hypothetical protein
LPVRDFVARFYPSGNARRHVERWLRQNLPAVVSAGSVRAEGGKAWPFIRDVTWRLASAAGVSGPMMDGALRTAAVVAFMCTRDRLLHAQIACGLLTALPSAEALFWAEAVGRGEAAGITGRRLAASRPPPDRDEDPVAVAAAAARESPLPAYKALLASRSAATVAAAAATPPSGAAATLGGGLEDHFDVASSDERDSDDDDSDEGARDRTSACAAPGPQLHFHAPSPSEELAMAALRPLVTDPRVAIDVLSQYERDVDHDLTSLASVLAGAVMLSGAELTMRGVLEYVRAVCSRLRMPLPLEFMLVTGDVAPGAMRTLLRLLPADEVEDMLALVADDEAWVASPESLCEIIATIATHKRPDGPSVWRDDAARQELQRWCMRPEGVAPFTAEVLRAWPEVGRYHDISLGPLDLVIPLLTARRSGGPRAALQRKTWARVVAAAPPTPSAVLVEQVLAAERGDDVHFPPDGTWMSGPCLDRLPADERVDTAVLAALTHLQPLPRPDPRPAHTMAMALAVVHAACADAGYPPTALYRVMLVRAVLWGPISTAAAACAVVRDTELKKLQAAGDLAIDALRVPPAAL